MPCDWQGRDYAGFNHADRNDPAFKGKYGNELGWSDAGVDAGVAVYPVGETGVRAMFPGMNLEDDGSCVYNRLTQPSVEKRCMFEDRAPQGPPEHVRLVAYSLVHDKAHPFVAEFSHPVNSHLTQTGM